MKTTRYLALTLTTALAALPVMTRAQPNDAQIAAIVVVANQVDVDAGKFVAAASQSSAVRDFAQKMVTDHTAVNQSAVALATKLNLTPEDNDTSKALQAGGDKNLARLRTLNGAALDRAYVEHEVAYHEQVIQALDTALIPNARNAELKALLVQVRPAFIEHLGHAKHLQASLK
jgi:putative membrane protein